MKSVEATTTTSDTGTVPAGSMRAIIQDGYGSADTLTLRVVPTPQLESDEVLIDISAAGLDRGVWHLMAGEPYLVRLLGYGLTKPKTKIPGADVAGRVVAVGDAVERFSVGDEVFGIASGAYAEFAAASESKLARKPSNITHEEAAAAAVSGITALQALTDVAGVEAGQTVLVIGASGGVGSFAVQIARALGAKVTGVASGAKADLVRSLGATDVIDYETTDYLDGSTKYDLVIDIGGLNPIRSLRRALNRKGTLVIVGGEGGGRLTGGIGRQMRASMLSPFVPQRLTMFISKEHHSYIERLGALIASGDVVPAVGDRFELADTATAIRRLEEGQVAGKAVIVVEERS
jgi:NADPH:quinone reductase-like Zn-dependent oxidoreductase